MNARALIGRLLEAPEDAGDQEVNRYLNQVVPRVSRPYTVAELRALTNNGENYVDANVAVGLWELIEHDTEWLNDYVAEQIAGSCVALTDIGFSPVGVDGDSVVINVVASVADWLAEQQAE